MKTECCYLDLQCGSAHEKQALSNSHFAVMCSTTEGKENINAHNKLTKLLFDTAGDTTTDIAVSGFRLADGISLN